MRNVCNLGDPLWLHRSKGFAISSVPGNTVTSIHNRKMEGYNRKSSAEIRRSGSPALPEAPWRRLRGNEFNAQARLSQALCWLFAGYGSR
jgi:hypothetical protein